MTWSLSLLLLAGTVAEIPSGTADRQVFDNYTQAYHAAQEGEKPMLVILNPGEASDAEPVTMEAVEKTAERRELLKNYVVAVIDTETDHGKTVHKLFDSPQLPRVAVIDKDQKWQVYRTSESLQGYQWTAVLKTFKNGAQTTRLYNYNYCPSCQRRGYSYR